MPRVRVALVSGTAHMLPRWVAAWVEDIRQSNFASVESIAVLHFTPRRSESAAFGLYKKLIGERMGGLADPLIPVPIPAGIRVIDSLPEPDSIDVLVFVDSVVPLRELSGLKYPVWWLHPAQAASRYTGDPPYFWEARDDNPVSGVTLMGRWPDDDSPRILSEAVVASDRTIYAARNRVAPYWTAADMFVDSLRKFHSGGREAFERRHDISVEREQGGNKRAGAPGVMDLVPWVVPALKEKVARRLQPQQTLVSEWRVAVRRGGDLLQSADDLSGFEFLPAPRGHFYADPFPVHGDGNCWLFVEDYVFAEGKAVLSCGRLSADLRFTDVHVVLDRPYHLSFPHVFQHRGDWYMMPESNANGTLDLYVAERFPYEWKLQRTLWTGKVVDATLLCSENYIWWFVTVVEPKGRGMKLLLFYSDSIAGQWHLHPASPLTRDVRTARGAGAILNLDGRLYRPSQDCAQRYGYGFRLNEILELTPEQYREREVLFIEPWISGMLATHTYNRSEDLEAVDANWFVPEASVRAAT